jgi:hypothetical protein
LADAVESLARCIERVSNDGAIRFRWRIGPIEFSPILGEIVMAIVLKDAQKVTINISPVDAKGNAAKVDGAPVWAVSDPTILTLAPSTDGLSCVATTTGVVGTTKIAITADADIGEGVQTISGSIDIEVVGGVAAGLNITIVGVEDIPVEPTATEPAIEPTPVEGTVTEPDVTEPTPVEDTATEPTTT